MLTKSDIVRIMAKAKRSDYGRTFTDEQKSEAEELLCLLDNVLQAELDTGLVDFVGIYLSNHYAAKTSHT